jgi:hypothetical protein
MATIISEASSEADMDQFFGASFSQLQDVDDVYHTDEPDKVCCAHIIDNNVDDENHDNSPTTSMDRNPHHDFELIMYLTSQRVNNKGDVRVIHYEWGRPDLISHGYNSPCAESIIDYADAIRLKLKLAGIHDSADLMAIFEDQTIVEASALFKTQLNDVEQTGPKTSTVCLLKEETIRHIAHTSYNSIRYNQMIDEIGMDEEPAVFPWANVLLHHTVSAVSINQRRHKPNRWVNKVTLKLINCDITTVELLKSKLQSDTLNDHIHKRHQPRLHPSNHDLRISIDIGNGGFSSGPVLKEDRMPYQTYDTGWIKTIYSTACLGYFLLSNGLLPRFTLYSLYNNVYNPFATMISAMCDFIGRIGISIGIHVIVLSPPSLTNSIIFNPFTILSYILNHTYHTSPVGHLPPFDMVVQICHIERHHQESI